MKITTSNYLKAVEDFGLNNLPPIFQQVHNTFAKEDADDGWELHKEDADFRKDVNFCFGKLGDYLDKPNASKKTSQSLSLRIRIAEAEAKALELELLLLDF